MLTTLHAQTAPSAWRRFWSDGCPRLHGLRSRFAVVSQRLIRSLHDCAVESPLTLEERAKIAKWGFEAPETGMRAVGCAGCNGTGYLGRIAAAELVPTPEFRELASTPGTPVSEIEKAARAAGWETPCRCLLRLPRRQNDHCRS